jgi:choline dehydrogenase-like flavoprotein
LPQLEMAVSLRDMKNYDVLVAGGGAAGLSAALVLLRARRTVVVVDAGAPRNAPAAHLHGFLSRDSLPPRDLLAAGRSEVSGYGDHLIDGTVVDVEPEFHRSEVPGLYFRGCRGSTPAGRPCWASSTTTPPSWQTASPTG